MGFRYPVLSIVFCFIFLAGCIGPAQDIQNSSIDVSINLSENQINKKVIVNISENKSDSTAYNFSPVYSGDGKLIVYFFHMPQCPACKSIRPKVEDLGLRYQNWTEWRGFNINIDDDREIYFQFVKEFNIRPERSGVPMIMVNQTILWGKYEINDSLEQIINGSIRH
jgi:thiol-disulfide isomerase/thioredoxin